MNRLNHKNACFVLALVVLVLTPVSVPAQNRGAEPESKAGARSEMVRLTIVVTGGKEKKPVENASVYVKFVEKRTFAKDKKVEMDLKTDMTGVCHTPEIPTGKFLIQVVAPGWNTFGEYYEVDQTKKTIQINLAPPPKWY